VGEGCGRQRKAVDGSGKKTKGVTWSCDVLLKYRSVVTITITVSLTITTAHPLPLTHYLSPNTSHPIPLLVVQDFDDGTTSFGWLKPNLIYRRGGTEHAVVKTLIQMCPAPKKCLLQSMRFVVQTKIINPQDMMVRRTVSCDA
jgi:hypothetical protein